MPKLSRFFAASSDLLMVTQAQGAEAYRINPAFSRTLGWQEPDLAATSFLELVHPDDAPSAEAALSRLKRGDQAVEAAFRMRAKAGGWRCIEWHATAFPEEGLHYWLGRDITDRPRIDGTGAAAETSALRESMGDAYFAVDSNWNITAVNRRATDLAQVTRGEAIGAYLWDVLWQMRATNSPGYRYFNQAMAERVQIEFEQYNPTHGFWASVSVYPQADGGLWVFVRDVSARKAAEEALRASEERLRLAQDLGRIGSYDWDIASGRTEVSASYRRIFGLSPEIAVTAALFETLLHPDDRARAPDEIRAILRRGDRHEGEYRIIRPSDGEVRWIQYHGGTIRDASGRALRSIGVVRDVTRRKQAELALAASEERLRLAQALGGVGSFDWDVDGDEVAVSAELCRIFGLPDEHRLASGRFFDELVHPDHSAPLRDALRASIVGEDEFKSEFRIVRLSDRQLRWIRMQAGVVRDERRTRFIGIVRDVTERRREQERVQLLMREVDHRGKNLLAVMRSVVQRTRAASTKQFAAAVTGRIEALARVHTLLADSGWEGVELASLVRDELAPFEPTVTRARLTGPSVELRPAAAQMMGLVFHELTTNAVKHGALTVPDGRVAVDWACDGDAGGLSLRWTERGGPEVRPPDEAGFG